MTTTTGANVNATQDLFSLSFTTKPDAGDDGLDFLRPDVYTTEQLLAEVVDLIKHPDNAHVESVEVRRVSTDGAVAPKLTPVSLLGSNAYAGFEFRLFTATEHPRTVVTSGHQEAAELLVEALSTRETWQFTITW